jgi:hypothetical protein
VLALARAKPDVVVFAAATVAGPASHAVRVLPVGTQQEKMRALGRRLAHAPPRPLYLVDRSFLI